MASYLSRPPNTTNHMLYLNQLNYCMPMNVVAVFFGVTVIAENLQNSNKNFCNRQTACSSGFSPKETRGLKESSVNCLKPSM